MPIITSHIMTKTAANEEILKSIRERGLCSLQSIPDQVTVNPVLQTQRLQGNICVNYINLTDLTEIERKSTLKDAVFEEYCGIYGISLERQWPFQQITSNELLKEEMRQRLNSSIVFMLHPPTLYKNTLELPSLIGPTTLAFYEVDSKGLLDGPSQNFGRNLLDLSVVRCRRMTELKTTHHFSTQEIMAIFVPESFFALAQEIYKDLHIDIVKVKQCPQTFRDIPDILNQLHQQKLKAPISLSVPDYANAIFAYTKAHRLNEFSLHAVRLHTQFDFITRKVNSITRHQALLERTQAVVQHRYPDDSAWITVHKNFGLTKANLFERLQHSTPDHIDMMKFAARESMVLFEALSQAKDADSSLTFIYQELSKYQMMRLEKIGVDITQQPYFSILSFAKILKPQVDAIIKSPKNLAATTIQSATRGFWVRKDPLLIADSTQELGSKIT